jgi:hypothetical protein
MVSAGMNRVLSGNSYGSNVSVPGYVPPSDEASNAHYDAVGADYFRTMGIPLVAGREFNGAPLL